MNKSVISHTPVGTVWDPTFSGRYYTDEDQLLVNNKLEKYSELLNEENNKPIDEQLEKENSNNNIVKKR
ncbi:MAG: hypothetical protein IJO43_04635 [Bacilli bacterium]|nr:hypothetical protein [Bacilli bacterium]